MAERTLLTRAELRERRAAVAAEPRLGRVSELRIGLSLLLAVLALLGGVVFERGPLRWLPGVLLMVPLGLLAARLALEPRKRRAGYSCEACGGTFPTDADDYRLVVRSGHCLCCGARVLEDPEVPEGSHRLPPMTALGER